MKTRYANEFGFAEMWNVNPTTWVLHLLYVQPEHRGHGHAKALVEQVLDDADNEGVTVGLQVAGDIDGDNAMTDAQLMAWYKQLDFFHDDRFKNPGRLIRRPVANPSA